MFILFLSKHNDSFYVIKQILGYLGIAIWNFLILLLLSPFIYDKIFKFWLFRFENIMQGSLEVTHTFIKTLKVYA